MKYHIIIKVYKRKKADIAKLFSIPRTNISAEMKKKSSGTCSKYTSIWIETEVHCARQIPTFKKGEKQQKRNIE
jgi:hypothetical protein